MLSKFCSKWYFYPISSKIACVYFARNDIFVYLQQNKRKDYGTENYRKKAGD